MAGQTYTGHAFSQRLRVGQALLPVHSRETGAGDRQECLSYTHGGMITTGLMSGNACRHEAAAGFRDSAHGTAE